VTSERLLSVAINNNNNTSVVFSVNCNQKLRKINIFWDMMYNFVVRY